MDDAEALATLELDITLIELIEAGLVEEMEINGEPHYGLTIAGTAYAEQLDQLGEGRLNAVTLGRMAENGWIEIRARKHAVTEAGLGALASLIPPAGREERLQRFLSDNPGATRTQIIRDCFTGNVERAQIDAMLDELLGKGGVRAETRRTAGRPATCYYLMEEQPLAVAT